MKNSASCHHSLGRRAGRTFLCLGLTFLSAQSLRAQQRYLMGNPSNEQQYMLELINRARANGSAEAARLGLGSLQEGPPSVGGEPWTIANSVQPLAWSPLLANSAQGQADLLNGADQFFLGGSPHTFGGTTPEERIANAGFDAAPYSGPTTPSGYYPGPENVAEEVSQGSNYVGSNLTAAILRAHNNLFTDQRTPGRGHRDTTMLGFFRDVGIGISIGADNMSHPGQPGGAYDSLYIVQDFGTQTGESPRITGVVYYDSNHNGFYDPGEGIGGVRVDVPGSNYYAVTTSSGGYTVPVPGDGTYNVTFSGTVATKTKSVTIFNSQNAKSDDVSSAPGPTLLANISTRMRVETGDKVLIGGFIVTGKTSKQILIRAIGSSLDIADHLANPTLELHNGAGALIETNDNWQSSANKQAIIDSGIPPLDNLESAIVRTVNPGNYTAIVRGVNGGTGVALVEVYDLTPSLTSELANISTRGNVETGDDVMIGGTIVTGQQPQDVLIRAIGPSLSLADKLADPTLELHDANGDIIAYNDNWKDSQQMAIEATKTAPTNDLESAMVETLTPGPYTAIVRGAGGTTGVALVEFYVLQ